MLACAAALSGAAAISHELIWVRRLGETLGQTAIAVNVVLAVFFAGLGAGAWLAGRWVDRRGGSIRCFVVLECVVAAFGLAFLPLCAALERTLVSSSTLATSLGVVAVIGVPALAMGGAIPALARHVVARADEIAPRVGWLYGWNTLGGAAAPLLVVFVAIPTLGVFATVALAATANLAAAGLGILAARATGTPDADARLAPDAALASPTPLSPRSALALAALTGFVAVGLEVLWTRALAARFTSTVYSFATILFVTLLCLGAGALLVARLARVFARPAALAALLASAGVAALLSLRALHSIAPLAPASGFSGVARAELRTAIAVMAAPLLLFGVTFPLLVSLARRDVARLGAATGRVYLANAAGSVAAPLAVGFLALPALGLETSAAALAWIAVLAGAAVALASMRARLAPSLATAGCAFGAAALATWMLPSDLRLWRDHAYETLVEYREGVSASVAVVDDVDGERLLKVNHHYRLGGTRGRLAQARQGLLPLLLHPEPRAALMLGLGTGCSAGAAAAHGGVALDVVEILPEVAGVLPRFDAITFGLRDRLASDPSVRLLAADARRFVAAADRRYDVIVGDLFVPWRAGEGAMYTREHFAAARARLADGGLFVQWLPLHQLGPPQLWTVIATFCDAFPHASAWWLYLSPDAPVIGLVGSNAPLAIDLPRLEARLADPTRRAVLDAAGLTDARATLASWIADGATLRRFAASAPIETRDRPRIEFESPVAAPEASGPSAANLLAMLALAEHETGVGPYATFAGDARAEVVAERRALAHLMRAVHAATFERSRPRALEHCLAALEAAPRWRSAAINVAQAADAVMREGDLDLAQRGADALLRAPGAAHLGHFLAARIALAREDRDGAAAHLRAALEIEPSHEASRQMLRQLETPAR